jgi:integrase
MSLKLRGNTWHLCIAAPGGEIIRRTTGTSDRKQAQEFHDTLKAELWRTAKLGEKPIRTWDEAAYQWLIEKEGKATIDDDAAKIRWLTESFRGKTLGELTRAFVMKVTSVKSNSTANRYTALVRSIMNQAKREWQWIDTVPAYFMRKEPKRRVRSLTHVQVQTLLLELPQHQRDLVIFALCTGLRQGNVKSLTWAQVDFDMRTAFIHVTKNGEPLGVPLNDTAMSVLQRIKDSREETLPWQPVFMYRGKSLKQVNTKAWRSALLRAGIKDFRWHDLRHVWATWHVQNGTPLFALQEMAGWKSESMVRRYAYLSPEHLRKFTTATELHNYCTNVDAENQAPLEPA